MARRVAIAIVLLALILSATWWLVRGGPRRAVAGLEGWAGERLLEIANRRLRPQVAFDRLEYDFPATFVLHGATLTDEGTRVVEARSLTVTLDGIPKRDGPFIIETVSADALVVRLIEREDGSLLGFHDMIDRAPEATPSGPEGKGRTDDGFAIRTIDVADGRLEWHVPGHEPLILDGIALRTRFEKKSDAAQYDVALHLDRESLGEVSLDASLDLAAPALEIARGRLAVELAPERYGMLPPALQALVSAHEVRGALQAEVRGMLALGGEGENDLTGGLRLEKGSISFGEYVLPVELLAFDATIARGAATFDGFEVQAFGGRIDGTGHVRSGQRWAGDVTLRAADVHLEQALRPKAGAPPRFSGRLTLSGSASADDLDAIPQTIRGEGRVEVRSGSLVRLPGFGDIVEAVTGGRNAAAGAEETTASFALVPGEARLRELTYVSTAMAGRGEGEIHFAGTVNVRFNAGPLEKVQSELGPVGDLLGKVTDRILTYQLLGPIEDPVVEVRPLGLGVK